MLQIMMDMEVAVTEKSIPDTSPPSLAQNQEASEHYQ